MNSNPKIHLIVLSEDAVSNAIARRYQVLNAEESKGVMGGQIDREFSEWMNSKKLITRPVVK